VEIKTGSPVASFKDVFEQGYEAIFLATGAWVSQKMGIPNEDSRGVLHGLDFLNKVNSGEKVDLGQRVAVIGGGNAAVDAARVAKRLGAKDVNIVYRRSRAEMPADADEVDAAEEEGIKLHILAAPVKVLAKDGKVTGIQCIKMELGEPDESGRRRPVPVKGSEFDMDVDSVIMAVGQGVKKEALPKELEYTNWGTIKVDQTTLQTNSEALTGKRAGPYRLRGWKRYPRREWKRRRGRRCPPLTPASGKALPRSSWAMTRRQPSPKPSAA
jgi:heterodisulfide reductase subunit A